MILCSQDALAADGCVKDTECKGDRICVQGQCVDPAQKFSAFGGQGMAQTELPNFMGIFSGGAVFENSFGGAGFNIGMGVGGRGSYFTLAGLLRSGMRWEDGDPKVEAGVEFGYRFMKRLASGLVPHFVITIGYNRLIQFDEDHDTAYHWDIPNVRVGGGLMWRTKGRVNLGFEICYFGGYAFHANADENPWGEVYEWQYNGGHIHYIMTF